MSSDSTAEMGVVEQVPILQSSEEAVLETGGKDTKNPLDYKFGDDIVDYLPSRTILDVPTSSEMKNLYLNRDEASRSVNQEYIRFLDHLHQTIKDKAASTLEIAKLKMELMYIKYSRPIPAELPNAQSTSSTPLPTPSGADVGKLPPGFGKRRGVNKTSGDPKKPKTPTDLVANESTDKT